MDRIQGGLLLHVEKQPSYKIISQKETLGEHRGNIPQVRALDEEGFRL